MDCFRIKNAQQKRVIANEAADSSEVGESPAMSDTASAPQA